MKKRDKKASHVGFMLSFAIFLTFIVFLFVAFNPIINFREDKKAVLEDLEEAFLEMIDSDLTNIESMESRYNGGEYEGLKSDLGVSDNIDFAFSFVDEGVDIDVGTIPEDVNVYTKEVFVLYYDETGEDYGGFLTIKIW